MMTRFGVACILLAGVVLAACQAKGPATNRPDFRFQWLSYLQAEDMRAGCVPGSPDRVRVIYNADFNGEIRTWDLFIAEGGSGVLDSRRWNSSATIVMTGGSINRALDPEKGQIALSRDQVRRLTDAFGRSGFPGPVPVGERLRSDSYFWVAQACVDGIFGIQVWQGERLRNIAFAQVLEEYDPIAAPLAHASIAPLPPFSTVVAGNRRERDGGLLFYEAEVLPASVRAWWRT